MSSTEAPHTEDGWYVPLDLVRQVGCIGAAIILTHVIEFEDITNINVSRVLSEIPIPEKELRKHLNRLVELALIPPQPCGAMEAK